MQWGKGNKKEANIIVSPLPASAWWAYGDLNREPALQIVGVEPFGVESLPHRVGDRVVRQVECLCHLFGVV